MKTIFLFLGLALGALPAAAGQAGCVYDMAGDVQVRRAGAADWTPARKGLPVGEGDGLRTGPGAWCDLLFGDGTYVKMDADSETAAETLRTSAEGRAFSFSFLKGKALWLAARLKAKAAGTFTVRTPSAVCAVRGTAFAMAVSTAGATSVGLFEGKVGVSSSGAEKALLPGSEAVSSAPGEVLVQARLSRLMKAEQRRYDRVKGRVEALRKRMAAREGFIDDYIARQQKALSDFEKRRAGKLGKR